MEHLYISAVRLIVKKNVFREAIATKAALLPKFHTASRYSR
jgi:hypothetical protein